MTQIQLECFLAAALNGSLSTAAKSLFLSTQVVSQHIQHLEAEIDHQLFVRSKNGVTLTEYGQKFFNLASEWSVLYKDAIRNMEEYYVCLSASLSIGLSEYVDYMGEISNPIVAFTSSHKNVLINGNHYKSSDLLKQIEEKTLDIAIIPDSQIVSGGDFEVAPFAKEDLHLFISADIKNKKNLKIGSKELDEIVKKIPQLNTSYGVWTDKEWEEVSNRMSLSQDYRPQKFYELPNFRSVAVTLRSFPASAVCDVRFGYKVGKSIFRTPLKTESWLCCVWHKQNENRLIHEFSDHMINYYGEAKG